MDQALLTKMLTSGAAWEGNKPPDPLLPSVSATCHCSAVCAFLWTTAVPAEAGRSYKEPRKKHLASFMDVLPTTCCHSQAPHTDTPGSTGAMNRQQCFWSSQVIGDLEIQTGDFLRHLIASRLTASTVSIPRVSTHFLETHPHGTGHNAASTH